MAIEQKHWAKELEKPLYDTWKDTHAYAFDDRSHQPVYSIDTPPPYVNMPIHIGQATTYILMDMFARYNRMNGKNILFPLGLDRNGLPIEIAAEREFKVKLSDVGREQAVEYCRKILEKCSAASTETFLRLGISFNSWKRGESIGDVYHTDSPEYRAITQGTFIDLWDKGLIYEDERINNYCPGCQTTIADAEIEYENLSTDFNDIVFTVKETGERIIIGTTRPELVCTCGMVIYHPSDERYQHLSGKRAITPLFEREVPIQPHTLADPEKGTGIVMMCSAGDTSDIRFFRDMQIKPIIAINADGRMNDNAAFLKGLKVAEARKEMITRLDEKGLLVKQRKILHRTPICERSKDPIEFISMREYYVKQLEYKETMKELAKKLNFFADESRQIFLDWIESVSIDWPISRRRYYATEIPLWHCKKCQKTLLPPKGKYYQPWKEPYPGTCTCGSTDTVGETRVFDTWFDSSISPLYILMYERNKEFFTKHQPCTLRPQGKEIIRTWLYYTILKDYLLTGKLIFQDVWINYHIVDDKGKKMSKSKGNVIDPMQVIDKFGAEPLRLWSAVEGNLTKADFRCSLERIEGAHKTLVKLWNVARFISSFEYDGTEVNLLPTDLWIRNEVNRLVSLAHELYAQYDFHNPSTQVKHFIWETFASHYLELVKNRAYNRDGKFSPAERNGAIETLNYCLDRILLIMAPVVPFITATIYHELHKQDIHKETFPSAEKLHNLAFTTNDIMELNRQLWKAKQDAGKSLKEPLSRVILPEIFRTIIADITTTHNIQKVEWGELHIEV